MTEAAQGGELLKMSELAKRAGVPRGTIQHYLREGLLPRPVKTYRNMAYYDADCVERIRQIKDLQANQRLPLAQIREIVAPLDGGDSTARALVAAQQAALKTLTPAPASGALTRAEAAKAFGIKLRAIKNLERMGLITARVDGRRTVFDGCDLEVLAAVAALGEIGLTERSGFRTEDLRIYRTTLSELIDEEVRVFLRAVTEKGGGMETAEMARAGIEKATMLIVALRRKLITDLLRKRKF